jgi:ABC-type multidrug transport system fused ATPase/permease subunit
MSIRGIGGTGVNIGTREGGRRYNRGIAAPAPPSAPPAGARKRRIPKLSSVWREARDIVWARRGRLAVGLLLMLVSRLAGLVLPASSKYLIDDVLMQKRVELLVPLALAAGLASLVQAVTSFSLSQLLGVAAQRAITELRRKVHEHILRLPVSYFDSVKSGELVSRVLNDAEGIRNLVGTGLVQLLGSVVTATAALGVLLWLNWKLTLVTLSVMLLFAVGMGWAFRSLRPLFRERGQIQGEVTGRLSESLGGVRVVKAYTAERREERVFTRGVHRLLRNVARTITATSGVHAFSTLVFGSVGVVMMIVGGRAILAGTMTLGDFVMYVFFTGMLAAPLVQIASIATQLSEAFAGLDRIRDVQKLVTEDAEDAGKRPLPRVRGEVAMEGVWFEYSAGKPVLMDVSFHAPAGTTTALVGPSGSGKSTLIHLVLAFARPTAGRVLVDGNDLTEVRLRDYRDHVGVVLQDNFLFDGTVLENITYSRPEATFDEVREVARIAHCAEFVEGFADGYQTIIGERGVKLSGGQRQRLAIARAILADPRILILDEATSSLDSESEAKIQDALRALRRGRTTFVIAHRLSTITSADQILVLDHGKLVERGIHRDLLARGGRYRDLYEAQHRIVTDLYINPGEDPVPESEHAALPVPDRGTGSGLMP